MTPGRRILHEPLLHFVALGVILYGGYRIVQAHRSDSTIVITPERVTQVAEQYRQQYGAYPSAQQQAGLLDRFIDEEIFYREALRLGLDQADEIVRRRLVQKYEFLQADLTDPPAPSEKQLRDYFQQNLQRYRLPERVSFTHVYFSADKHGEAGARDAAARLAANLNQQGATHAADMGDRFSGPTDFVSLSAEGIARVFGQGGLAAEIFSLPAGRWSAPIQSGLGWHAVFVSSHEPGRDADFGEMRARVADDLREANRARQRAMLMQTLRRQYEIIRR